MKNKISPMLIIVLSAFLVITVGSVAFASTQMPRFTLTNALDNKQVDSSVFAGKALFVSFFATWCPPCRLEVGEFKKLQENFANKGFSVVAISVDQNGVAPVADFVKSEGINYPVLMATLKVTQDFGGIFGIPTAFLVNKDGNVVKRYQGFVNYDMLAKDIHSILK